MSRGEGVFLVSHLALEVLFNEHKWCFKNYLHDNLLLILFSLSKIAGLIPNISLQFYKYFWALASI